MKRVLLVLLMLAMFLFPGCATEQSGTASAEAPYTSDTSSEDCYLCGGGAENLLPSFYWGQDNIALLSLNTFDIVPIEINRYDRLTGQLIEEYAGTTSLAGGGSIAGGFSANLMIDDDRGFANDTLNFGDDETLDINKAAEFLCEDCLNEILPSQSAQYFGVGVIHFDTKEVRVFEKRLGGFSLGDFYVDCNLTDQDSGQMHILIFYCPIRFQAGIHPM